MTTIALISRMPAVFPCIFNSGSTCLPPLDDLYFHELCTDVYYELIRRGKVMPDGEQFHQLCLQDDPHKAAVRASQRLAWLPVNIFNGLARDIYFEVCDRFPWIVWSHPESCLQNYPFTRINNGFKGDLPKMARPQRLYPSDAPYTMPICEQYPEPVDNLRPQGRMRKQHDVALVSPNQFASIARDNCGPPLDVPSALIYLDSIKNRFQSHPILYNNFLSIVRDSRFGRVDTRVLSCRVGKIFAANPALIEGFFLPPMHPIEHFLGSSDTLFHVREETPSTQEKDKTKLAPRSWTSEPFSKKSPLCLDGQISRLSKYSVVSGGFADVWTGLLGRQKVAIKIMRAFSSTGTPIQRTKLRKRLWREYLAWSHLHHENVLECLGFSYRFTPQSEYEVPSLISPWMSNGTVLTYLETHQNVDRLNLLLGIAAGLSYLHSRKPAVVHGDIRAGNILVSDTGAPCLTDFGLSRILSDITGMTTSSEPAGSVRWMSPELLHDDKVSESSDVWAYGMTILEISSGKRPYNEFNLEPVVLRKIIEGDLPSRPSKSLMNDEFWRACQQCWYIQPMLRPSMHKVAATLSAIKVAHNIDMASLPQ